MGHSNVVRALIECAKQSKDRLLGRMLSCRSKKGNLALHDAAESNNPEIIQLLIQEDADLIQVLNHQKQSPLYVAVEKGYYDVADLMLSSDLASASIGSLNSENGFRTALHAAAIGNNAKCVKLISEKLPYLKEKVDEFGWTPLHYAAKLNRKEVAEQLLIANRSMAYVKSESNGTGREKAGERTALHVAVCEGNVQIVDCILSHCPDCWEMFTRQGKNVIHLAVENDKKEVMEFMLTNSWASGLNNQKDMHGNTPLHLYAARRNLLGNSPINHFEVDKTAISGAACNPQDSKIDTAQPVASETNILTKSTDPMGEVSATQGPEDVISPKKGVKVPKRMQSKVLSAKEKERQVAESERMMDSYMIVATLIITVSFAAGFTIPGGYEGNEGARKGLAVLSNEAAFQAFVVFDALALMASTVVVAIILGVPSKKDRRAHLKYHKRCRLLIAFSLQALGISFFTGLYLTIPVRGIKIFEFIVLGLFIVFSLLFGAFILPN